MTDEELMTAVKNGDLQPASLLFERYHKRIFNYLVRMTIDVSAAEDLTQNAFLRMLKYRNSFKEDSKFQPWIYQIARNVFSDEYQRTKMWKTSDVDSERIREHLADMDDSEIQSERERLLHKSMEKLSDEQKELLILTRFQRMKYEEVAEIHNTTVANIKVKVHRAIAKLREHYFELEQH